MPYPYNGVIAAQSNFQKGVINYHNFSQTKKKVTNGGTLYKNGLWMKGTLLLGYNADHAVWQRPNATVLLHVALLGHSRS